MKSQIDEPIGVTQVHLHPIQLCRQVDCQTLGDDLHLRVNRFNCAAKTIGVEHLIEEVWERVDKNLSDCD